MSRERAPRRGPAHPLGALSAGICSICSAHPAVIRAAFEEARAGPVLIEATSNQVNQLGGYTGMRPADFAAFVHRLADLAGFPRERVLLGGDHLGPNPFRREPAGTAMDRGCAMVAGYVRAGFTKIHLDASMPLGGDPAGRGSALPVRTAAERCAELCAAAEAAHEEGGGAAAPVYVIGTEVPVPGGTLAAGGPAGGPAAGGPPEVTRPDDLEQTLAETRAAFRRRGLERAWERVAAVVVQTGAEFGDQAVHPYRRERFRPLRAVLERYPGLVFEGHSTDYQLPDALRRMVEDGIAVLKVGPALTFALREALFLLCRIEEELFDPAEPGAAPSGLIERLDEQMRRDPAHWQGYFRGTERELALARRYSLSDRSRYYWSLPEMRQAVDRLFANLRRRPPPLTLLSQYFPRQYRSIRSGALAPDPEAIARDRVREVLEDYRQAAGP
jgi:D-tagatose-1,6-bisphosphate aldolase subunit GatZ/KbaZ